MDSPYFLMCIIGIWRWINSSFCIVSLSETVFCYFCNSLGIIRRNAMSISRFYPVEFMMLARQRCKAPVNLERLNFYKKILIISVSRLILRCSPADVEIIPGQVIFPFFQIVRKQRLFRTIPGKHEIVSIKEFHRMTPESFRTVC